MLSETSRKTIESEAVKYPPDQRQSAIMAALRIAQDEHKWLSAELIEHVAEIIGVPSIRAYEIATFYSMYELDPVGRHKISVCTNISCMLRGSENVVKHLKRKLGIDFGETTKDGRITLKEVECLGACSGAPMMQVNEDYHENLTPKSINKILELLK